jgi:ubiquitin-activating enzyme E1
MLSRTSFLSSVRISKIYETVTKTKIAPHIRSLVFDIMCEDLEGNDIDDVPYVKYMLQQHTV